MKTTVEIADSLLIEAKVIAHQNATTLRELVEEGLRLTIQQRKRNTKFKLKDGSVNGTGLQQPMTWQEILAESYKGRGA